MTQPNTTDALHKLLDLASDVGVSFEFARRAVEWLEANGYLWRDDTGNLHPIYHQQSEDDDLYAAGYDKGWRAAITAQRNAWSRQRRR